MNFNTNDRRKFLKTVTAIGTTAALPNFLQAADFLNEDAPAKEGDGFTFLFQGDSITDGARTRNNDWNHVMGHGYQYIIAGKLWYEHPAKKFQIFNRGVSGNKVTDLAARWQKDALDIKPDVLSILIGINDVSAFVNGNSAYAVDAYETGYRALLNQTKQQLPGILFILCEPFILPAGKLMDKWEQYSTEVKKRQQIVKALSDEFNAIFVPLQEAFDKAVQKAPAEYWIWDGIHPMPAGHELIAREWLKHVGKKLKFIKA